jgi:hypothetical protein
MAKIEVKKVSSHRTSGLGVMQVSSSYKFMPKAEENQN